MLSDSVSRAFVVAESDEFEMPAMYRPEFPDRFGCIQDSRAFCQGFFRWYNGEHLSLAKMMTDFEINSLRTGL
jgi:hypothetical protein